MSIRDTANREREESVENDEEKAEEERVLFRSVANLRRAVIRAIAGEGFRLLLSKGVSLSLFVFPFALFSDPSRNCMG